ncbi:MAG: NAD(P)H-dependent oxidoreductase [Rhodoferax sp.]|nr:NAD(P)H-dependent oxidoreductase [Rhodoferax sp.]
MLAATLAKRPSSVNPPAVPTLLIVYQSTTGGAHQMALAAQRGALRAGGAAVRLLHARDATPDDVLAAQGYLWVTPEMLGAVGGLMKDFFDRSYYAVLDRIAARPYALLVCAGSDGQAAVRQVERIATGWRLRAVAPPRIVCTHAQTPQAILAPKQIGAADLQACEELGEAIASGLALGVF